MKMDEAADHHLKEEVDLMEMDGIKSNLAWQEIEVDNLMEMDEAADHHLREEVDLMDIDEKTY